MRTFVFLILAAVAFQDQATIQMQDFPAPFAGQCPIKPIGLVHTVLTIRQRGDKVFGTTVEVYDLNGKLIELLSNNAGIEIHSGSMFRMGGKSTFTYAPSGNLIKENHFTAEGQPASYENYLYDSENRIIEKVLYSLNGKEFERKSYKYFPQKFEIEWTRKVDYDKRAKPPSKYLIGFNEKGQATKWIDYDSNGALSKDYISFEYDSNGNLTKEAHCCTYRYAYRYSYKFDKQGNWIEQQTSSGPFDDKRKEEADPDWMYTYRIITYYSDNKQEPGNGALFKKGMQRTRD